MADASVRPSLRTPVDISRRTATTSQMDYPWPVEALSTGYGRVSTITSGAVARNGVASMARTGHPRARADTTPCPTSSASPQEPQVRCPRSVPSPADRGRARLSQQPGRGPRRHRRRVRSRSSTDGRQPEHPQSPIVHVRRYGFLAGITSAEPLQGLFTVHLDPDECRVELTLVGWHGVSGGHAHHGSAPALTARPSAYDADPIGRGPGVGPHRAATSPQ